MSRVHPGKSDSYQYKILRRKERSFDRELLRLAKIQHTKELGVGAPLDPPTGRSSDRPQTLRGCGRVFAHVNTPAVLFTC